MSFVHGFLQILQIIVAGLVHLRIGELDIPLVDLVLQLNFTLVQDAHDPVFGSLQRCTSFECAHHADKFQQTFHFLLARLAQLRHQTIPTNRNAFRTSTRSTIIRKGNLILFSFGDRSCFQQLSLRCSGRSSRLPLPMWDLDRGSGVSFQLRLHIYSESSGKCEIPSFSFIWYRLRSIVVAFEPLEEMSCSLCIN